eukprot:1860209-Rhodomonas_salina.5
MWVIASWIMTDGQIDVLYLQEEQQARSPKTPAPGTIKQTVKTGKVECGCQMGATWVQVALAMRKNGLFLAPTIWVANLDAKIAISVIQ